MVRRKLDSERLCKNCKTLFKPRKDLTKRGLGIFCSTQCSNAGRSISLKITRDTILTAYKKERSIHKTAKALGVGWKPLYKRMKELGMDTKRGALRHPKTYETCYLSQENKMRIPVHRKVAEKKYGRLLKREEVVHHLDGDRQNNKPENLVIMSRKLHSIAHNQLDEIVYILIRNGLIEYHEEFGYIISRKMEVVLDGNRKP